MTNKDNRIQMGGQPDYEDFDAVVATGATVTPGMLVEVTNLADDGTLTVQPHSTDGEMPSVPLFVDVLPYSGDTTTDAAPVADTESDGDYVKVIGAKRYNRVNALLAAGADLAAGSDANISQYEDLASAGDGTLRSTETTAGSTFAHSREANDNSAAAAGETVRLIVEVQ